MDPPNTLVSGNSMDVLRELETNASAGAVVEGSVA
jgi:hypothetical protein